MINHTLTELFRIYRAKSKDMNDKIQYSKVFRTLVYQSQMHITDCKITYEQRNRYSGQRPAQYWYNRAVSLQDFKMVAERKWKRVKRYRLLVSSGMRGCALAESYQCLVLSYSCLPTPH